MGNFAVGRLQGRRHDQRHARLHGLSLKSPRVRAARRGRADRHDPHSGGRPERRRREEVPGLHVASADAQTKLNAAQWASCRSTRTPRLNEDDPFLKAGFEMLSTNPRAASRSSSTATRRRKWPRSAWKASRSSWCSPTSSTTSLSGSEKPASASTSSEADHDGRPTVPAGAFRAPDNRAGPGLHSAHFHGEECSNDRFIDHGNACRVCDAKHLVLETQSSARAPWLFLAPGIMFMFAGLRDLADLRQLHLAVFLPNGTASATRHGSEWPTMSSC
jgi:hypothetical protein